MSDRQRAATFARLAASHCWVGFAEHHRSCLIAAIFRGLIGKGRDALMTMLAPTPPRRGAMATMIKPTLGLSLREEVDVEMSYFRPGAAALWSAASGNAARAREGPRAPYRDAEPPRRVHAGRHADLDAPPWGARTSAP